MARLFGVGPEGGHLDACPDCARRWEAIQLQYENRRMTYSEVTEDRLAEQRKAVRARLENKPRKLRLVLAPSLAAAAVLLMIGLIIFKPTTPGLPPQALDTVSEDKVIEDIFRMSLSTEPEAFGPVQSLFEEQQ